ncbi:MAG: septal ring lytic transglycosylase RlpA family protein [Desulfovibrionaceae bacterium]|nr:septal ring lytic transglycosylase RlpA family protein [Desulfovibrionaceae bacterium]
MNAGRFRWLLCWGLLALLALSVAGCGSRGGSWSKGGVVGSKPYTVRGKTYYPLKSAHGFVEVGVASWYGPGFHGKKTANGERFNQYAMTAAHKTLPLGTKVRVTHLSNGRSILVRVNDRGPFVDDRVIDLSRGAAQRLDMIGSGTARVRIQSLSGGVPQIDESGDISGPFYVQVGAFAQKVQARSLAQALQKAGHKGRLKYGSNNMWNVQIGPWTDSGSAQRILQAVRVLCPNAFVLGDN